MTLAWDKWYKSSQHTHFVKKLYSVIVIQYHIFSDKVEELKKYLACSTNIHNESIKNTVKQCKLLYQECANWMQGPYYFHSVLQFFSLPSTSRSSFMSLLFLHRRARQLSNILTSGTYLAVLWSSEDTRGHMTDISGTWLGLL